MKFLIVAIVLAVLANAEAAPRFKSKMVPQPRVSCHQLVLNIGGTDFGSDSDTACAAHCLILGYPSGGHCDEHQICVCTA
ncbi:defensin, isoforms B and C-like [Branchiostoma floridae x Branchiostoma belcheri]